LHLLGGSIVEHIHDRFPVVEMNATGGGSEPVRDVNCLVDRGLLELRESHGVGRRGRGTDRRGERGSRKDGKVRP
jgi:hypothetical protein